MDILTIITPVLGVALPYITEFVKNKRWIDGKKLIFVLCIAAAFWLHLANSYVGEIAVQEFLKSMAEIAWVAMTWYNFMIKKTS